ncbi:MAG: class F sortase, partial [Ornithinimicrobium sp.]
MSDDKGASSIESSRPSHRALARSVQVSVPVLAIVVGLVSLLVVASSVVGFRMGGDGSSGEIGPGLAAEAAATQDRDDEVSTADSPGPDKVGVTAPAPLPGEDDAAPQGSSSIEGPANRGMLHVKPTSVSIPAIGVESDLVSLGLNPDNSLQVPQDYSKAGWFTGGSYPGDLGGPPA